LWAPEVAAAGGDGGDDERASRVDGVDGHYGGDGGVVVPAVMPQKLARGPVSTRFAALGGIWRSAIELERPLEAAREESAREMGMRGESERSQPASSVVVVRDGRCLADMIWWHVATADFGGGVGGLKQRLLDAADIKSVYEVVVARGDKRAAIAGEDDVCLRPRTLERCDWTLDGICVASAKHADIPQRDFRVAIARGKELHRARAARD